MQKFTPCLWFDGNAEEAAGLYVSVFSNSRITGITRYGEAGPPLSARSRRGLWETRDRLTYTSISQRGETR